MLNATTSSSNDHPQPTPAPVNRIERGPFVDRDLKGAFQIALDMNLIATHASFTGDLSAQAVA